MAAIRCKSTAYVGHFTRRLFLAVALIWLLGPKAERLRAQDQDGYLYSVGIPTYKATLPVENGDISLANGALHLEIPLVSAPQRGGREFKATLIYDSNIWGLSGYPTNIAAANCTLCESLAGWRLVTSADPGYVENTEVDGGPCNNGGADEWSKYQGFVWVAPDGTSHGFNFQTEQGWQTACNSGSQNNHGVGGSYALDSSGYYMASDSNWNITVRAPDGTEVYPKAEDSNGNFYTYGSPWTTVSCTTWWGCGGMIVPTVKDSLGRTLLTASVSGSTLYIYVLNSQGTTSTYTVTTALIPLVAQFPKGGGNYYVFSNNSINAIQAVQLPDGTSYSFKYDCPTTSGSACGGNSNGAYNYGEVTSMTLPTLGTVSYKYATLVIGGGVNTGAYYQRMLTSRTTPDSATPWTYAVQWSAGWWTNTPPVTQTFTATKPNGDTDVYTLVPGGSSYGSQGTFTGGLWPSVAQYYTGNASASNLLATINQSFNFSTLCSTLGNPQIAACTRFAAVYVTKSSQATTLPVPGSTNVVQTTQFTWDSGSQGGQSGVTLYGDMLTRSDWNFGSSLSNPADRTTTYTYLNGSSYITANILNRVASKTVTTSSGGTVAKTLNTYDGSTLVSGAVGSCPAVTNSSGHDDTNYGTGNTVRGNLTQVQQLTNGSNYLTTSKTYDILGQPRTSTDSNQNTTTYCYADSFFNDGGNIANPQPGSGDNPTTATNAFLTTVTHPIANGVTLTDKYGYYFGTGQKAFSTDPNNQTTYFHYYDLLNRPTSVEYPNGGWNLSAYTGETQVDTGIGITSTTQSTSCTGTSGGCRHDETLLDGLGRASSKILESDPDGPDTVTTTYDADGRVYTVTNPHRSTSSPTDGTETYTYDGLDRKLTDTHADSQTASTSYGASVTTLGGLSAQKCSNVGYPVLTIDEAKHLHQTWTDGFGRLVEVDEPSASGSLSSGIGTCYGYDLNNNLISVNQGSGSVTRSFAYDDLSRLTAATNPESGTINYSYTSSGSPCSGDPSEVCVRTDARNITTSYVYDALNRIAAKFFSDGTWPAYYYYDQTGYSNSLGRLNAMDTYNSGAGVWVTAAWFNYDPVGNMTAQTAWVNNVYESSYYNYNLDSSISSITYPSSRQVNYLTSNAQRTTMAYDSSNTYAQGPSSGCPFNQSNGKGWACYAPPGELDALQNGAKLLTTSFYSNRLQPCRFAVNTGTTAPSSCTDASHFGDKFDVQYSFDLSTLGSQLCSLTYGSHTNNGNVASITNNISGMGGRSQEFCYDALNRLTSAQTTSTYSTNSQTCWAEAYGIDAFGNLTSITPITSNSNGSYVGCTQESGFSTTIKSGTNQDTASCYDAGGNKAGANPGSCSPLPTTYTYDGENRLISYAPAGESYTYDAHGKRVEKNSGSSGTLYWYDRGGSVLAETTTSGTDVNEYVFFGGKRIARVNSSGNVFYYFADQLGTSRVNVQDGSTPSLCYDADFYPYGGERNTPDPPYTDSCAQNYKFTGKERDSESGLDNFGARYDSSQYGRFMSPDPERGSAIVSNPQTFNRYTYALNNPLAFLDVGGKCVAPATGPGQVGICIESYIQAKRLGSFGSMNWFGYGDNRGPVANDPNATYRTQTLVTFDLKTAAVSEFTSAGISRVMFYGGLPGVAAGSIPKDSYYMDDDGNIHFEVGVIGMNGFAANGYKSAPQGLIEMNFTFLVDPDGNVVLLESQSKPYPSVSVYSYSNGNTQDLFQQTESGNPDDLQKPMQDLQVFPKSDLGQLQDEVDCDKWHNGSCY